MWFGKPKNYYDITLALGGVFQAILLIRSLAQTGKMDEKAFGVSVDTLYKTTVEDTSSVYGDFAGIHIGLREVVNFFNTERKGQDADITRSLLELIHLERKLFYNKKVQNKLAACLVQMTRQRGFFPCMHPTLLSNLADTYSQTIGALKYRVQIVGRANYLRRQDVMDKVRALLLAGVRSVVLWRQVGGSRWQLFLARRQIFNIAEELCKKCVQKG